MSILIKDMEMPKSCRKCHISQPDGCGFICPIVTGCPVVDSLIDRRHARCPLVPVPPHGRLIDADALIAAHEQVCSRSMKFNLDLAPTIIPAEEER